MKLTSFERQKIGSRKHSPCRYFQQIKGTTIAFKPHRPDMYVPNPKVQQLSNETENRKKYEKSAFTGH